MPCPAGRYLLELRQKDHTAFSEKAVKTSSPVPSPDDRNFHNTAYEALDLQS